MLVLGLALSTAVLAMVVIAMIVTRATNGDVPQRWLDRCAPANRVHHVTRSPGYELSLTEQVEQGLARYASDYGRPFAPDMTDEDIMALRPCDDGTGKPCDD